MERLLRTRASAYLTLVAASAVLPITAMHFLTGDQPAPITGTQHLIVIAITATVAALASAALIVSGYRQRDTRAVIAGGAFAVMSTLLFLHGIATPGVLFGPNGVVALAGGMSLPLGAALLTLAALPSLRGPRHLKTVTAGAVVFVCGVVILGALGLVYATEVPAVPAYESPEAIAFLTAGVIGFAIVAARVVRTYVLTRRRSDLVVVVGIVWLALALIPTFVLTPFTWAWWMGHVLELVGIALVAVPVALDTWRRQPSRPLVGDLPAADLVAQEEAFLGARVAGLLDRLAEKDGSTEEHTRRVSAWAVSIGEEIGLTPARLRDLALAGLLHDIGKLSTPDAILAKPGALSDDEMAVIREHPGAGDELLAELGYPARVRKIVRGHHERLDGNGYPDGLRAQQLDRETRILTVADVWDALVSPRVYRAAWTPERAMGLLVEETGVAFDRDCVLALQRVLARQAGLVAEAA
ncbi:MAG: HD-GYP domain-containing protein [Solirubrobacteraceae bacterium]|nr:HD-GYP domain-containing protein [Solirubrobacteraceae bacterium]